MASQRVKRRGRGNVGKHQHRLGARDFILVSQEGKGKSGQVK